MTSSDVQSRRSDFDLLDVIELRDGMGSMQEAYLCRAIVRTHGFSFRKETEQYFFSMLMLYLPWRSEQLDLVDWI